MTHFDTLTYARALKEAGVPEQQAEAHAVALRDVVADEVATKADLATVEAALKSDIASVEAILKSDITSVKAALKSDITSVEGNLKSNIASVEANLKTDIAELKGEINLLKWMMGFVLAMLAALLWLTIRSAV